MRMDANATSKNKARFLVIGIFLIGFAAGALSMNLYRVAQGGNPAPHPKRVGFNPTEHAIDKMTKHLALDQDQQGKIRAILDEQFGHYKQMRDKAEPEIEQVRRKGREQMRAVLRPDQIPKFEGMCIELDRKREEFREHEKK
jgi:hypothetical protein